MGALQTLDTDGGGADFTQTVLAAMRAHPDSAAVQEHGLALLGAATCEGSGEALGSLIVDHGVGAALTAMASHAGAVVGQGGEKQLLAILDSGCLDMLRQALDVASTCGDSDHAVDMAERSLGTLVMLASKLEVSTQAMATEGVLAAVLRVRNKLEDDEEVDHLAGLLVELLE